MFSIRIDPQLGIVVLRGIAHGQSGLVFRNRLAQPFLEPNVQVVDLAPVVVFESQVPVGFLGFSDAVVVIVIAVAVIVVAAAAVVVVVVAAVVTTLG